MSVDILARALASQALAATGTPPNLSNSVATWNAAGTVFTGFKLNVTDTASDPASLLMDLQVGGVSKFTVNKAGGISTTRIDAATFVYSNGPNLALYNGSFLAGLGATFAFTPNQWFAAPDLILARDAANTLALRNGTAAQTFNFYGSYVDASNYERLGLFLNAGSSNYEIIAQNAGTGAVRNLAIGTSGPGAIVLRTNNADRWTFLTGGSLSALTDNAYDLGLVGASPRYIRAATQFQAIPTWNNAATTFPAPIFANVTDTASNAASLLMDLQKGGVSQFSVRKDGYTVSTFGMGFNNWYTVSGVVSANLTPVQGINGVNMAALSIASNVSLLGDAANTLALRNGTAAQTFNIYNTYTDASNYSRGFIRHTSNVLEIGSEGAGTGTGEQVAYKAVAAHRWYVGGVQCMLTDGVNLNFVGSGIIFNTDNAQDIGAVGNSPRYIRAATSLITNGATVTVNTPTLNLAQTWNNVATTFTGALLNVTDTASNGQSLLMDLQKGGVSQFKVDKLGNATMTGSLLLGNNNNLYFGGGVTLLNMSTATTLNWNNDVNLVRDAANTLAQRNGTAAQTFNIYNSFTDAANYERLGFTWSSNIAFLQTTNGGTGQPRPIGYNANAHLFYIGGSLKWQIDGNGNFIAYVDNTTDIGIVGNSPRYIRAATSLITNGATVTTNTPTLNLAQTWNAAAVAFTGAVLNVTDTTSAATSLLMDLQVGGVSKFSVQKNGVVQGQSFRSLTTGSGETTINYSAFGLQMGSICQVSWGNTPPAPDLFLTRDAANTLAQKNGTAAQTFRVYNTFTDASNYERGVFGFNGGALIIGAEVAGTGAYKNVAFQASSSLYFRSGSAVTDRWIIDGNGHLNGATDNTYDLGLVGASPRYIRAATSLITNGATVTTNTPTLNLAQAWNAVGTVFTSIKLNVTDTASDPASLLMDLQVGGVSKFKVDKFGAATVVNALVVGAGVNAFTYSMNGDTILARDAANTLAQRNGTAAQAFRAYNSFTDASNYERGVFDWTTTANTLTIGYQGAGTGATGRIVNIASASGSITFTAGFNQCWQMTTSSHFVAGADNLFDIGIVGNAPRYIRAASAIQTKALTVATLPAAATALAGARSFVTDSSVVAAGNFGAIVAGAGANATPVYSDGTNWRIG